jgi:SH3 domain-containing YSC84-like protein 1
VKSLLSGVVFQPDWAAPLYQALQAYTGPRGNSDWIHDAPQQNTGYGFEGLEGTPDGRISASRSRRDNNNRPVFPPSTWAHPEQSRSTFDSDFSNHQPSLSSSSSRAERPRQSWEELARQDTKSATATFQTQFDSDFQDEPSSPRSHRRNFSGPPDPSDPFAPPPYTESPKPRFATLNHGRTNSAYSTANSFRARGSMSRHSPVSDGWDEFGSDSKGRERPVFTQREELRQPISENQGVGRAIALFDFNAVEVITSPCFYPSVIFNLYIMYSLVICPSLKGKLS